MYVRMFVYVRIYTCIIYVYRMYMYTSHCIIECQKLPFNKAMANRQCMCTHPVCEHMPTILPVQ